LKIEVAADYKERRGREYPSLQEQIGAIWKILHALETDSETPEDAIQVQDSIDHIKNKYLKNKV